MQTAYSTRLYFTHLKLGFSAVLANFFIESGFFDLAKTLKIGH